MNKIKKIVVQLMMLVFVCMMLSCDSPGEVTYKNRAASIEDRVDDLLARMTTEEKVSQMRMFHQNQGIDFSEKGGMELSDNVKQRLVNGIGGIKNPGEHLSPENAASLNNQLQKYVIENNSLGIPAFFVTESYNGVDAQGSTRFPRPITLSSSWNRELEKMFTMRWGVKPACVAYT
jgi:beta-glucosidase